ncbi:hypothetical protein D3C71_2059930 [compost metagenome]
MPAVPAAPTMTTGIQICSRIDFAFAQLIGSARNFWSMRWPIEMPNQILAKYIMISASMKFGMAMPISPISDRP